MNIKFNYIRILFVLFLYTGIQLSSQGQNFLAEAAFTTKVAKISLGEGIAQKDQMLLDMVTKAGLMPVLSNGEDHTFFVPSEQALAQHTGDTPEKLKAYLEQHIVKGNLTTDDLRDGSDLKTLHGTNLRVCRKKGAILVDGVRLTEKNQLYENGVWHRLGGSFQKALSSL